MNHEQFVSASVDKPSSIEVNSAGIVEATEMVNHPSALRRFQPPSNLQGEAT